MNKTKWMREKETKAEIERKGEISRESKKISIYIYMRNARMYVWLHVCLYVCMYVCMYE